MLRFPYSTASRPDAAPERRSIRSQRRRSTRRRTLFFESLESRQLLASVSGQVVYDFDGDAKLDPSEPGLADWHVYVDANNNSRFDTGELDAQTDASGRYVITGLAAGAHVVRHEIPGGWQLTYPPVTGRQTVVLTADQALADVNFGDQRVFTAFVADNILVTRSSLTDHNLLLEYTPEGGLVQALVIPGSARFSSTIPKDLVLDSLNRVQMFNGYDDVRLTTFDPATQTFADTAVPGWDMGRTYDNWGDIAAFGDFVFANEQVDDSGSANGLIRFRVSGDPAVSDLSYQRYSEGIGTPTDVTVGLDGLLYVTSATAVNTTLYVYDPQTMAPVRTLNIPEQLDSVAVDGQGNLYATTSGGLKRFTSDGTPVRADDGTPVPPRADLMGDDLAISRDGQLLLPSSLQIQITDTAFSEVTSFPVLGEAGTNFLSFAAFVQAPVAVSPGVSVGDFGVFEAGNILVSNSPADGSVPRLSEYTPLGQLVREFDIPAHEAGGARGLTVDAGGLVRIYDGTFQPQLTTFDPHPLPTTGQPAGFSDSGSYPGWSTAANVTFGHLAAVGDYVFATDDRTGKDTLTDRGLIRYDRQTGDFERCLSEYGDILDVSVGLDGLLYTLGPVGDMLGTVVRRYHPVTMQLLGSTVLPASHRAIAVDSNGDIVAAGLDIDRYGSDGILLGTLPKGDIGLLTDIDMDSDGRILVAAQDGSVLLTDRDFTSPLTFLTRDTAGGMNFATFVGPTRGFPKAVPDSFTVTQDTTTPLDVLLNDENGGVGLLTIDAAGPGSAGGTVTLLGNTLLSYTPPRGFVGLETFTYTLSDGVGGTDSAVVTITVEGTGRFLAVDDSYLLDEDGDLSVPPLSGPPPFGWLENDGQLTVSPVLAAGNLLVSRSPVGKGVSAVLQEVTTAGIVVGTTTLPDFSGGYGDVRDLVLDRDGLVQVFNGTLAPRLTTYDPEQNAMTHQAYAGWSVVSSATYGGLATWRNHVFATDQVTSGDVVGVDNGIIRWDRDSNTVERMADDGNYIDLAVGLSDGLLYALGLSSTTPTAYIRVFDPLTKQRIREIGNLDPNLRAIAVDGNGNILAVMSGRDSIYRYDPNGLLRRQYSTGMGTDAFFSDIDINPRTGAVAVANVNFSGSAGANQGDIVLTTTGLFGHRVVRIGNDSSDMMFVAWVEAPVGTLTLPLQVSAVTTPAHGTLTYARDGSFQYTPDADFFGTDGFRYTVQDGDGLQQWTSVTLTVTPQNDPPLLTPVGLSAMADENVPYTTPVTALVNGGPATTRITDIDVNDPVGGIAITGTTGLGTWSYSLNNSVFVDLGTVSDGDAMLVPYDTWLRFTPIAGAGGTATPTDDYMALTGTVTIPAGSGSAVIDVSGIVDDAIIEGDETVIVTLTGTSNPAVTVKASAAKATVTIDDNDDTGVAQVSITASDAWAGETAPNPGRFTVSLSGGPTMAADVSVNYTVAGSATPADDYPALTGTVTIPAGSDSAVIDVSGIVDDAIIEGDETVIVTLTGTSNPAVTVKASAAEATVTIDDNDDDDTGVVQVSITASDAVAGETPTNPGQFTVSLSGGLTTMTDLTVRYWVAGTAALTYRAWDTTAGTTGHRYPVETLACSLGEVLQPDGLCSDLLPPTVVTDDAFSLDHDTLTLAIANLNDAPILTPVAPVLGSTDEETPFSIAVGQFAGGVYDADTGSGVAGIAVVAATGNGLWQYAADGSAAFQLLPPVSDGAALLLTSGSRLQYTPDSRNGEEVAISYRAWDKTDGAAAGTVADTQTHGGTTAFSNATDTARLSVIPVNDAPVLTAVSPQLGFTDVITPASRKLADFVRGITDVDAGDVVGGIAVTAVTGQGSWSYSADALNYTALPAVSETAALLLPASSWLRYTPTGGSPEPAVTVTYRAWDVSQGAPRTTASVADSGGTTPFSSAADTATLTVRAVNQAPALTAPGPVVAYTENDPPTALFPSVSVTDSDSPDFAGGALIVNMVSGGTADDRIAVGAAQNLFVAGDRVFYDGGTGPHQIGTYVVHDWQLTVVLTGPYATPAAVQALARAVTYENVSDNPNAAPRLVQLGVKDGDGGNDSATVTQTVTITPVNDPPLALSETYSVYSGGALYVNALNGVLANDHDVEGPPLTAELVSGPAHGQLTLSPDGAFTYRPDVFSYGVDTFSYQAYDGQPGTGYSPVVVVGLDVLLPACNPSHPADVNGDGWLSPVDPLLIANYLDGHGAGPLPEPAQGPPFLDYDGDGSVTGEDATTALQDVSSTGARQLPDPHLEVPQTAPVLGAGEFVQFRLQVTNAAGTPITSIDAGQSFFVDVFVSDKRVFHPQGVFSAYLNLTYDSSLVSTAGPIAFGAAFPQFRSGTLASGRIDNTGAGRGDFTVDVAEQLLLHLAFRADARGTVTFDTGAADGTPAWATLLRGIDGAVPSQNITYPTATLTIQGPPVAANDGYPLLEDTLLDVSAPGVLFNDTDDNGLALQALLVDGPAHGTLTLHADGSFRYQPAANFFGTDTFRYKANNGTFDSLPATVTVTVSNVNDSPVAVNDRYSGYIGELLSVSSAQGVLANDYDVDAEGLTVQVVQKPLHGQLQLSPDGSFTYQPDAQFGGQDQFTYWASDGQADAPVATVVIDVLYGWQNPLHAVDVNADGYASPLDPLLIFNDIARHGERRLPNPPVPPVVPPPFLDFNGDGSVSAFDTLKALEAVDATGARPLPAPRLELAQTIPVLPDGTLVQFRLSTTDAAGNARSQFEVGEDFLLRVYATDLRTAGAGLFSAYLDVSYATPALTVTGPVQWGSSFPYVHAGSSAVTGVLDEFGGTRGTTAPGATEALLYSIPMRATRSGQYTLTSNQADVLPAGDVTLFGIDGAIPQNRIAFGTTTLSIALTDGDGDGVGDAEENAAPHGGDGNGDGVADRLQGNVASLRSPVNGQFVTFASPVGTQLRNVMSSDNAALPAGPAGVAFPFGSFEFRLTGLTAGQATTLRVRPAAGVNVNAYYRYGPTPDDGTPHWYSFLYNETTGAVVAAGYFDVYLVDGSRGDDDLTANGVVVDALALALVANPWQNSPVPEDVNNDGAVTAEDALILINDINTRSARVLPAVPPAGETVPPFLDVTGDGQLSASDVLAVVNYLNTHVLNTHVAAGEGESAAAGTPAASLGEVAAAAPLPSADREDDVVPAVRAETRNTLARRRMAAPVSQAVELSGEEWDAALADIASVWQRLA